MKAKAEIFAQLQRDLLALQPFKAADAVDAIGLHHINRAFPNQRFPFAGVHEFFCSGEEEATVSSAFIAGLLSLHAKGRGVVIWISSAQRLFPPALNAFGLPPEQVFFLYQQKEKDIAWVVEEALNCQSLLAVVGELRELDFTTSRRFQLAIEKSGVGCFMLRRNPRNMQTAVLTRWQLQSIASVTTDNLPGMGHPTWQVNLLKVRNGKPGTWNLEWKNGRFRTVPQQTVVPELLQRKTG